MAAKTEKTPKALIIAEKPSVATDLSRVLSKHPNVGSFEKKKDYFESDAYIVTSAVGHLVQQQMPKTADGKNLPWKFECLPVIPEEFVLEPIDGNKGRLNLLHRLIKRKDVTEVINACDAGREGELIFLYILRTAGVEKPTRRMWMQSMTNNAILDAFNAMRDEDSMIPLGNAAVCRSESDWLVGINSTRAMTAFNSKYGGFNKTPVGRVQTPTLAMLAERELEIQAFVAETYWEVHGSFGVEAGTYPGRWFDESFKKNPENKHARAERIWDEATAKLIVQRCTGQPGIIEETKKPSKSNPPALYDLTSLQRDANGRFGFSARRTLQIAQGLYERHKVVTYPRTDSKFLPDDYIDTVKETLNNLTKLHSTGQHAKKVLDNNWVVPSKRIFNTEKVSDHFAIIPTGQIPSGLSDVELKLYNAILCRFIAIFFPAAEFEITSRITRIGEDAFKSDGKVLVVPGYLEVYGKSATNNQPPKEEEDEDAESTSAKKKDKILVAAKEGETAEAKSIDLKETQTRPPARYNEATLLSAMETAGKKVSEEELRDAMSERGLGTPATRAATIEGLIRDKYVVRDGRDFFVNTRGLRLIEQLKNMEIAILASPEMTGEWEYKLKQMEQDKFSREQFMEEIKSLTRNIVKTADQYAKDELNREYPPFEAPCPVCGAPELGQDDGRIKCKKDDCKFNLPKVIASRPLTVDEAKELLTKKELGPLTGFISRFKQPFDATIVLQEDKKNGLKAGFVFEKSEAELAEEAAISEENKLCECPLCKDGHIYVTPTSFLCNERANGNGCKARLSKVMCQYEIPRDQALKYFTEGKTDLIDKFISKKGRPFSAHLLCNTKGRRMLGWQFPPRKKKEPAAKKKTATKKKTAAKKKETPADDVPATPQGE